MTIEQVKVFTCDLCRETSTEKMEVAIRGDNKHVCDFCVDKLQKTTKFLLHTSINAEGSKLTLHNPQNSTRILIKHNQTGECCIDHGSTIELPIPCVPAKNDDAKGKLIEAIRKSVFDHSATCREAVKELILKFNDSDDCGPTRAEKCIREIELLHCGSGAYTIIHERTERIIKRYNKGE